MIITREEYLKGLYDSKVVDLNNPSCINCIECCTAFTVVTEEEFKKLKKYFTKDKKGREIFISSMKRKIELQDKHQAISTGCPFANLKSKRCSIYNLRPKVCRDFHCKASLNKHIKDTDYARLTIHKLVEDILK